MFEQTGSQAQTGPVKVSTNRAPQLRPSQVRVTDAAGQACAVSGIT